jgi:hypothetical protein
LNEKAHFQRHEEALFTRHRPLNSELYGLRRRACIGDRHGLSVSMHQEIFPRQRG